MARSCCVLECGREQLNGIPCDFNLLKNPFARPAEWRGYCASGAEVICCDQCRRKYANNQLDWSKLPDEQPKPQPQESVNLPIGDIDFAVLFEVAKLVTIRIGA